MAWSARYTILILSALSVFTPLSTYTVAVLKGHVDWFLPHIGKTGDEPPESTLFTQLVVFTTASLLLCMHIRFVFVSWFCSAYGIESFYAKLNTISRYIGYVLCVGLLLLACFQASNSWYVHTVSSTLLFTIGIFFYILIQTLISYRLRRYTHTERFVYGRVILNLLIFASTSTYLIAFMLSNWRCKPEQCGKTRWNQDEMRVWYHSIAAVSEWFLLVLYVGYILTYYTEFKMISLTTTKIYVTPRSENASSEVGT